MDFFRRNSGKIALLAIIAFFTLPFIYSNEEEEDFSPFAVKSGMSYQVNPISKLASKIASFYGFSKPASKVVASANGVDSIKGKVTFSKENPFGQIGNTNSQNDTLVASSRNFKSFDVADSNSPQIYNTKDNPSINSYDTKINNPVKGYITVNGQDYPVIEDARGEKFVVTPKGHIAYKDLTRRTISEQEFAAAKKRLAGASDMEVLAALQEEKLRQIYPAQTNQNYQAAAGYGNGVASTMGGTNVVRVSVEDKGLDNEILSTAYSDLKNINLKISTSSSAGGASLRDSFNAGISGSKEGADISSQGADFVPQSIAEQAKTVARHELIAQNNKPTENMQEEKQNEPTIVRVISDNDSYQETENNSETVFISVEEGKNSPYEIWGEINKHKFKNGTERSGIIAQISIDPKGSLNYNGEDRQMAEYVENINQSIKDIQEIMYEFKDTDKVYIDLSTVDEFSKALIMNNEGLSDYITTNPNGASINLPGPICTPDSFKQFAEELQKQQIKLLAERKHNSAA